ncbi:MAG TPA: SUMF1/EgtB/PvdO family nonheme iron enzyme, partial [Gemmataceae bacterium]|nr:SUMF1/EgtB/PvdO family nonheme iron enzyme [Gemmataceae bacterium]
MSAADAEAMADYLTKTEGVTYRLPTEAEWRWACRAGANTRYPFGGSPKELSWYARYKNNSQGHPGPVGTMRPNAWGLRDMLGNVREWTADGLGPYPEGVVADPRVPQKSNGPRVQCGGTFEGSPEHAGRPLGR